MHNRRDFRLKPIVTQSFVKSYTVGNKAYAKRVSLSIPLKHIAILQGWPEVIPWQKKPFGEPRLYVTSTATPGRLSYKFS